MRMRTQALLLAVGGIALALLVLWCINIPTEPTYDGRTLSQWLALYEETSTARDAGATTRSNEIVQAIRAIGTNGIPFALEWLKYDRQTAYGPKLGKAISQLPFSSSLPQQPLLTLLNAAERRSQYSGPIFSCLGSNAALAIPALVKMAYATNAAMPSERAVMCLGMIGTNAFPALIQMFGDTNFPKRAWVIRSMAWAHYRHVEDWSIALPLAVKSLNDPDTNVCSMAYVALGWFRIEPDICLPLLTNALASTNQFQQKSALYGLRGFGQQGTSAIPLVIPLLTNSDRQLRFSATNTLRQIDSNSVFLQ